MRGDRGSHEVHNLSRQDEDAQTGKTTTCQEGEAQTGCTKTWRGREAQPGSTETWREGEVLTGKIDPAKMRNFSLQFSQEGKP